MPGQTLAPLPGEGRLAGGQRIIPPLPAGISIFPQKVKALKPPRRLSGCLIALIVLAGFAALMALLWFSISYSDYDSKQIDPVVTRAVMAHVPKGTRLPVTLRGGPRLIEIESAFPNRQPGRAPDTVVLSYIIDPKTGAKDPKYAHGADTLIEGVAITIR